MDVRRCYYRVLSAYWFWIFSLICYWKPFCFVAAKFQSACSQFPAVIVGACLDAFPLDANSHRAHSFRTTIGLGFPVTCTAVSSSLSVSDAAKDYLLCQLRADQYGLIGNSLGAALAVSQFPQRHHLRWLLFRDSACKNTTKNAFKAIERGHYSIADAIRGRLLPLVITGSGISVNTTEQTNNATKTSYQPIKGSWTLPNGRHQPFSPHSLHG